MRFNFFWLFGPKEYSKNSDKKDKCKLNVRRMTKMVSRMESGRSFNLWLRGPCFLENSQWNISWVQKVVSYTCRDELFVLQSPNHSFFGGMWWACMYILILWRIHMHILFATNKIIEYMMLFVNWVKYVTCGCMGMCFSTYLFGLKLNWYSDDWWLMTDD